MPVLPAGDTVRQTHAGFSVSQRVQLEQYMSEHIRENIKPIDLAEVLRLSHDYFTRKFGTTFELPPRAWIVREKVRFAEHLMAEERLNVSEAAYELGYRNVNLFSRQFKAIYGVSPKKFEGPGEA